MRYTLLNRDGVEQSIAIEESAFSKPITLDDKGQPASYEALGYSLGFADDTTRTPHSDASVKAAEKGVRYTEQRAAQFGQTAASVTDAAVSPKASTKGVPGDQVTAPVANATASAASKSK